MLICVGCRKELQCVKTGQAARYKGGYYCPGDRFQCQICKVEVLKCNDLGQHFEATKGEFFHANALDMDS